MTVSHINTVMADSVSRERQDTNRYDVDGNKTVISANISFLQFVSCQTLGCCQSNLLKQITLFVNVMFLISEALRDVYCV